MLIKYVFFLFVKHVLVECVIRQPFTVQKVDRSFIEKKRQDTIEMCKLFNSGNRRLEVTQNPVEYLRVARRRARREVSPEEARRVEGIVDNLYDYLGEDQPHAYRRANLSDSNPPAGRRFDFAPAAMDADVQTTTAAPPAPTAPPPPLTTPADINGTAWPKRWVNAIVPYYIDSKSYDEGLVEAITKAFDYFEQVTCVRLQRLPSRPEDRRSVQDVEWLYVANPTGIRQCVHSNEHKQNIGVQMVVFGYDCMSRGEIVHEVMHVLGFSHEHTRPDRDRHVAVAWDNIKPGYKKYFEVREEDMFLSLKYDYASVLHYPPRAFSRNGQPTIGTESGIKIGQREGLSETDVEKIGLVYGTECARRNREYLTITCPSALKFDARPGAEVNDRDIKDYFKNRLWPYGLINFSIRDQMEFSTEERENIKAVLRHIEKETCIQFREFTGADNDTDYTAGATRDPDHDGDARSGRRHADSLLTITRVERAGRCLCPPPGRVVGDMVLPLNSDCFDSVNNLLHAFVHVLGLEHQQNQHDRDRYITVLWDKLTPEVAREFKQLLPPAASAGFPYDYQSVMHTSWFQIDSGQKNVIYPVWDDGWTMGHWQGLSSTDVNKINLLYFEQCQERKKMDRS